MKAETTVAIARPRCDVLITGLEATSAAGLTSPGAAGLAISILLVKVQSRIILDDGRRRRIG
jgi:hypothetical protein